MVIGVLQVELTIEWATSLKDKRGVVQSTKDRLAREFKVSVAEIATQENAQVATLGIVLAASDVKVAQSILDRILDKLRVHKDAVLSEAQTEIISGYTPEEQE